MPFEPADDGIIPVDIGEEMKGSYLDYAMSTIIGRALPDVRDGLKPVQRRILYAMYEMGNVYGKPYKKSARVVGDVMGKYHPHGNDPIYDALVRMAQDFSMRYPLIDGQGNFGSIDGDAPAAMRYTEVRMAKIADEMLADIEEETVDFVPNYDNTITEPSVLPASFPNLIVNGASGIAVGMATNIPPHNIGEIVDACLHLIKDPQCSVADLMQFVKGPDFPTAATIVGTSGIREAYQTGKGQITVRAKGFIEPSTRGGRDKIIFTEIPYMVNKTQLLERIASLVSEGKLSEIADLRDESDREGLRIVVELKRDENANILLNKLYKFTRLQTTFGILMLALVDGRPKVMNLKEILRAYIDHRKRVIIRRTKFRLRKARQKEHILEGLKKAIESIDFVIKIIRQSKDTEHAKSQLMEELGLSDVQAQAILDTRLARLTSLEREKILQELEEIKKEIAYLESLLADVEKIMGVISEELLKIKEKYGDERKTEIVPEAEEITIEDIVADENMVVSVTKAGYIKRTPVSLYRSQRRGGKGVMSMKTKDDDFVEDLYVASSHDIMLFFSKRGIAYSLKVYELPETGRTAKGTHIANLLRLSPGDAIASTISIRQFSSNEFVLFATQKGYVKRTALSAFEKARRRGITAIQIGEDDELVACHLAVPGQETMLFTARGIAIRFPVKQVRPMGRTARGVIGIRLRKGDFVVALAIVSEPYEYVLVASEAGYGKLTRVEDFRVQRRGGKGIIAMRVTPEKGPLVGALYVAKDDEVVLISSDGILIRTTVSGISVLGRAARGVRLISLEEGQTLAGIAKVVEKDSDEKQYPLFDGETKED